MSPLSKSTNSSRTSLALFKPSKKPADNKERLKKACSTANDALTTILQIVKSVTGDLGVGPPGMQAGVSGILFVLDAIKVSLDRTHLA